MKRWNCILSPYNTQKLTQYTVKAKIMKFIFKKGVNFWALSLGKGLLAITQEQKVAKGKYRQIIFHLNFKTFVPHSMPPIKYQDTLQSWKKFLQIMCLCSIISRIKKYYNSIIKRQISQFLRWAMDINRNVPKELLLVRNNHVKKCSV